MERALGIDERIRRAEEIYQRRRQENNRKTYATVNVGNRNQKENNNKTIKKMFLQIAICIMIYLGYYMIQNSDYIFSEEVMNQTKNILSYNINFSQYYKNFMQLLNKSNDNKEKTEDNRNQIQNEVENEVENGEENAVNVLENSNNTNENIGGEDNASSEQVDKSNLSQMEIDAMDIKNSVSIIKPLEGTITSRFGIRNPTTLTVPKNHTGIDIAANIGTKIKAAMTGKVSLVSTQGDYGNHIKITNGDIMTLYAHCNKIYVSEGQEIKQGEIIAEVGNTGNTTGPHLHFEIRKSEQFVDPELVLGNL